MQGHHKPSRESWVLLVCFFSVLGSCAPQLSCTHGWGGGVFTERLVRSGHNSFTFLLLSFLSFPGQVLMPLNLVPGCILLCANSARCTGQVLSLKITIKSAIALLSLLFWTDQKLRILADPRNIHMRVSYALRTLKMVWGVEMGCWVSWDLRPFLCYASITNI